MIRAAILSVIMGAMLIKSAQAQNITTTGLPPDTQQSLAQGPCGFTSLFIRNLDGTCNHLGDYGAGKVGNFYSRGREGAQYAPGTTSDPWTTIDARVISNSVADDGQAPTLLGAPFGNEVFADQQVNILSVFFGQFLNHDLENNKLPPPSLNFSDTPAIADVTNDPVFRCTPPGTNNSNPFNPFNDCSARARKSLGEVVNGRFEVINNNNAWVDLSTIYSENATQSGALRTNQGGMLRLKDWTASGGVYANFTATIKNVLISQADTSSVVGSDIGFTINPQDIMVSGDVRASQDIPLTTMHVVWTREHNYQATRYQTLFPSATDEQLFQLARRYTIGEFQKVVYEEFLPAILGRPLSAYKGYNSSVSVETSTAFATGAFRYGHTVSRDFDMYDACSPNGDSLLNMYDNATATNLQLNPTRLLFQGQVFLLGTNGSSSPLDYPPARILALMGGRYGGDGVDNIINSMVRQRTARFDPQVANTLRNIPGNVDLFTIDIFRGRANGLPNYNTLRTYFNPQGSIYNNPACSSDATEDSDACWAVLTSNQTIASRLKSLYGKVNKVDAIVGLIAEDQKEAYLGPTVSGIIEDEFTRKRDGDRFFYENIYYFFAEEISAIKATSFRDIIQRTTNLDGLPANVFLTNEGTNSGTPHSKHCSA